MVWGRGRREIREAASQVIHREHFLNRNIFSLRPAGICKTVVCLCVCFVCVCVCVVCVCVCVCEAASPGASQVTVSSSSSSHDACILLLR